MKKIVLLIILAVCVIFVISACTSAQEENPQETTIAVKVEKITESENSTDLNYIGTVDSKGMIEYSFKSAGRLGKIYVQKGDQIKKGDRLAELDIQDLDFQLDASKSVMETAGLNIKKAEDSLNYQKDLFTKIEKLFTENAISKDQYDQAKLQYDISETSYNQAKSQYEAAKTDYEYNKSLLEDAFIYAQQDGSVVEIPFEESELVPQGYPVIIARTSKQVINIGIAQQDLKKINIGTKAIIDVDGETAEGAITNIAEAPDSATRTYNAEVTISDKDFRLGLIAKVSLETGKEKGIWIPMTAVSSNGEDYVYIIQNDRAFLRTVILDKAHENKVLVMNIKSGELLVTGGMKNLYDGAKVNIIEQEMK